MDERTLWIPTRCDASVCTCSSQPIHIHHIARAVDHIEGVEAGLSTDAPRTASSSACFASPHGKTSSLRASILHPLLLPLQPSSFTMLLLDSARKRYLLLGLFLRLILLIFGLYQDSHLSVPYTDIDYSVFLDGARQLVHGCPLSAAVPPHAQPGDSLDDFLEPPLAPAHGCAKGWLSLGARYILQHDDILTARSRGSQSAEGARQEMGEDATLSLIEPNAVETMLLPVSLAILKPILKPLAAMGNPYARTTYRYTPLLALVLAPGASVGGTFEKLWGKMLFVAADVLAALLMWDIMSYRRERRGPSTAATGSSLSAALKLLGDATHAVGVLWLLNPFPAQIATRGSCESLVVLLVLAFASAAARIVDGGASFELESYTEEEIEETPSEEKQDGLAARPVSPAAGTPMKQVRKRIFTPTPARPAPGSSPSASSSSEGGGLGLLPSLPLPLLAAPVLLALAAHLKLYPVIYGLPLLAALLSSSRSEPRWLDALGITGSASYAFFGLSGFTWLIWGAPYLEESLLYHVGRVDHRHNFSPYFLPLYLLHTPDTEGTLPLLGGGFWAGETISRLGAFLPQLAVVAYIGIRVGKKDLVAAMAAQTMAFVVWNKVSTSQVSVWSRILPFTDIQLTLSRHPPSLSTSSGTSPASPSSSPHSATPHPSSGGHASSSGQPRKPSGSHRRTSSSSRAKTSLCVCGRRGWCM